MGSLFGALGAAAGLAGWSNLVQRADGGGDHLRRDGGVAGGGIDSGVAEQHLDDADIGAVLQQVSGEAVPQRLLILLMNCTQLRFAIGVIRSMA